MLHVYPGRMIQFITPGVSALYRCGATYGEIHITTLYIRLNIPEPLGLLLAGESVEELELDWI